MKTHNDVAEISKLKKSGSIVPFIRHSGKGNISNRKPLKGSPGWGGREGGGGEMKGRAVQGSV